ncbi:MAG TPA: hypothetical protein VN108_01995 [Marmoricola sp.]|nr:hypothetical protein [Marmoricola sp.]
MGEDNTSSQWRALGPVFSPTSVFEELLNEWIAVLDEQLGTPIALGPDPRERLHMEAARASYARLRSGSR